MMVIDVVLCFSFDGFFVYVSGVFEEINPRKPKLVRYALDVDKVEFDLSQDPECHGFYYVNIRVSLEKLFCFVLLKAYVVRNTYLRFSVLT
jgi:hypothetical protein